MGEPNQKKTLTHKKKITALTLSTDGTRLISGDAGGLIYVWLLSHEDLPLKTFELHRDKGMVTNLVSLERPLSLFGLTANLNGYDPGQVKSLQRNVCPLDQIGPLPVNTVTQFRTKKPQM